VWKRLNPQTRRVAETLQRADRARNEGRFASASKDYAQALRLMPGRNDIRVQMANMLKDSGQFAAAEAAYLTALEEDPSNADTNLQLGHLHKLSGRRGAALAAYRRALQLDPLLAPALKELAAADVWAAELILEFPASKTMTTPMDQFIGWYVDAPGQRISLHVQGMEVEFATVARPDLPERRKGYSFFLDLARVLPEDEPLPSHLTLELRVAYQVRDSIVVELRDVARQQLAEIISNRTTKRDFILANCNVELELRPDCRAPSALPANWSIEPGLSHKTDAVSSHFYDGEIGEFIANVPEGGFVLDAGAGFRKRPVKNVVAVEIYDYPSTDVLAVGESLPFKDNVFDAVLSLAVLEHVRNPFICSKELVRVLKPGGKILTIVPFLQAEHGYPSHFFNATRFGLRSLFDGCVLERQSMGPSNLPIWTLNQILSLYVGGLPAASREQFLGMTVSEILNVVGDGGAWQQHPIVRELNEDIAWTIAWGTTGVFSKPS
jgi:Methyltransferase domain/Tetratricopeptide repeat